MSGEGVNSIALLNRELLLVDVGGAETHLAEGAPQGSGRPAANAERFDQTSLYYVASASRYDQRALLDPRWRETTLCGRRWQEMAAGESGGLHSWQETSLAPTCRSCLRVVDGWFPEVDAPAGVELLAAVIAEKVEAFGSVQITGIPAQHVEAVRRRARKHLRARGFRATTHVLEAVLLVASDDAYQAIDPQVRDSWIRDALAGITVGGAPNCDALGDAREPIDWHTWVIGD